MHVCLFMHDSLEAHYNALKHIFGYIQGTIYHGLHLYNVSTSQRLITYTDVDSCGRLGTRRSTSKYCCFLGENLIPWSSERQDTLSSSSTEAKYRRVANVVAESCWLCNLLLELHCPLRQAIIVYLIIAIYVIYISSNLIKHQCTNHVEMDIHFLHEKVALVQVWVLHVPTQY